LERFDFLASTVNVGDTEVNDAAPVSSSVGPDPLNQHVATVFIAIVAKQRLDWVVIGHFNLL
jgi:hypothetical protein